MLVNNSSPSSVPTSEPFSCAENDTATNKRKRRPAGTPDPDAEVVSLSPKTLLESDRYVCEICNQGFQRDQNLQMHRRRHKVPWKLLKRETPVVKKRVFVCPEPTCLHHDPCHALGDLVGIKKHFRRKHSNHKQWVCQRCSKGYAVQSDYKAHLKTCGTRGHSCDCGRVFSRVESFIEHQDACNVGRLGPETQAGACLSRTASSPSSDNNFSTGGPWPGGVIIPKPTVTTEPSFTNATAETNNKLHPNLELQLSTATPIDVIAVASPRDLQLCIGSLEKINNNNNNNEEEEKSLVQEQARDQLRIAMAEKAYAEEARRQAKRQIELAELEFTNAKRIRQQALAELDKAYALKDHAIKRINSTMLQITCLACKHHFQSRTITAPPDEHSLVLSYITTEAGQVARKTSCQN
ncbi:SHOOT GRAVITROPISM 5 protein [Spatholobus suberectus]|nr:SHOOT GRAVITROPISM 5 protein [Spatholobus suberectus]